MFSSDEWNQSNWSNKPEGKELKRKVYEETFWRKAAEVVKLAEPLVKVLRLVDGERLAMGFIYEAMDQAKERIKTIYKDRVAKYGPIWAIIDERWNNQLHRPIHAAGYFLNPRYHYKAKESGALRGEHNDGRPLVAIVLNCKDPNPPTSVSQPARTPIVGASSAQPRQKRSRISTLSQLASAAVAQPASGTTSTVAVGDDEEEEEPWGPLSDSDDDDLEIDQHDLCSSSSSY
eukprot:PITA_04304